ncbi:hypothetical protein [Variovorax sp. JS1663]|uniref:hypothetical protein n=1 Tax=Variovorax sp. JS1663 TaxID=1851577 RepID=UPI001302667B|nr:hypothetical protein [Variovorax sp. JS1663]
MSIDASAANRPPAMCAAECLREREVGRGAPEAQPAECVAGCAKRMGNPDLNLLLAATPEQRDAAGLLRFWPFQSAI